MKLTGFPVGGFKENLGAQREMCTKSYSLGILRVYGWYLTFSQFELLIMA